MGKYIIRRILVAIPTLLVISFVLYFILAMAPGDPLSQFANNPNVPPEVRDMIRVSLGLDKPWHIRYVKWLGAMLRGDWGFSYSSRVDVSVLIKQRLPNTLKVVGLAYLIGCLISIPVGVISAVKQYSWFDNVITTLAFIGISIPAFFSGLLLILLFSVKLKWLPFIFDSTLKVTNWSTFLQQVKQMILPVVTLAIQETGSLTRYTRSSVLDNLPQDYVRTARSKGLAEKTVIIGHVVRNSLIPVVTLFAMGIPYCFTGAIITEQLFRVNGIGELLIRSIQNSDTPVVMAITVIYAFLVVVFNLVADILYSVLDPRISYK